ncbi:MAG: hypothetical protein M1822_004035 [Bathelium mastoideum]|nr:MAG: hypothetical protein M1822_004035 [Bathelium mastoideum]
MSVPQPGAADSAEHLILRMPGAFPSDSALENDNLWSPTNRSSQDELPHIIDSDDVYIAIMGVTGAGKSTFISHCTQEDVAIGHGAASCTQDVTVYPCQYTSSCTIWLVDTPGFDDTNRTDTEVLREIASWLAITYKQNIKLRGIVYLHDINEKMRGSAKRNLYMFQKLCGSNALNRIILASTKWEEIDENKGILREKELSDKEEFWGYMKRNGSQVLRHYNNHDSAMKILSVLAPTSPKTANIVLDIQSQMVDHGKHLHETTAGMELQAEINRERKRHEVEKKELQIEFQKAQKKWDAEAMKALKTQKETLETETRRLDRDNAGLQATLHQLERTYGERLSEAERRLREALSRMRAQAEEHERSRATSEKRTRRMQKEHALEMRKQAETQRKQREEDELRHREAQQQAEALHRASLKEITAVHKGEQQQREASYEARLRQSEASHRAELKELQIDQKQLYQQQQETHKSVEDLRQQFEDSQLSTPVSSHTGPTTSTAPPGSPTSTPSPRSPRSTIPSTPSPRSARSTISSTPSPRSARSTISSTPSLSPTGTPPRSPNLTATPWHHPDPLYYHPDSLSDEEISDLVTDAR